MKEQINKVELFHKKFGVELTEIPSTIPNEEVVLRCQLLEEELHEYEEAAMNGDLVEIADALGDQLYIVFGTILRHGMQHIISEVFDAIQESNMSKLGKDGKPIINGKNGFNPDKPKGKLLKGPNYHEPNIKKIIEPWL